MIYKGMVLNENGDFNIQTQLDERGKITKGLTIGETDFQNVDLLIIANKGEFKEYPVLGVGAEKYLKTVGRKDEFRREINVQLDAIGYPKADVKVSDTGILDIDI